MTYRLLVVDDDFTNREVVKDALEDEAYELFYATDGYNALELLPRCDADAILLDLMMPGVDGLETLKQLKADPSTRDIPVVVLTAIRDVIRESCMREGAAAFLTKPISSTDLRTTLRRVLADAPNSLSGEMV